MIDELNKLYFEPSSRCNLACTMCFRNTWIGEALSDMDISIFNKALDSMPDTVHTIFFGGMGEPLVHKDIEYMVGRAADKGVRVELLTNGMLLTEEMSASLLDKGLDMLWISLDSVDAGEYEQIRTNGNLALIKQNIKAYNSERAKRDDSVEFSSISNKRQAKSGSFAKLGIAFVAMKSNAHQLGSLSSFAYEYNVSDINVSNISPTGIASLNESLSSRVVSIGLGAEGSGYPRFSLPVMDSRIDSVMEGLISLLKTDFNIAAGSEPSARKRRYCKFIGEGTAFVRHDGEVAPCMALLHSGTTYLENKKRIIRSHSFGNAGQQSLCDIWDSNEYTSFRQRVRDFDFSPCTQCGGCDNIDENVADCFGNSKPTCGACLWSEGILSCP